MDGEKQTIRAARFSVGERVRVVADNSAGNPRTPQYVRRRTGLVTASHGVIENPLDHRGTYPPLYSVVFDARELVGGGSIDQMSVDIHEDWLEPAGAAR